MLDKIDQLIIKRNNNFFLETDDFQVLSMLYKLIVGPKAIDFYITLYNISYESSPITKTTIFVIDLISDDNLKEADLEDYIRYLTKIKLIKFTDNLIELYPNYSASEIFKMPMISMIKRSTSFQHFSFLKERFMKDKDVIVNDNLNLSLTDLSKLIDYKVRKEDSIPYSFSELKQHANYLKDEDKKFFDSLSIVYNLSLEKMLNIIYESSLDDTYDINSILEIADRKHKNIILKEKRILNREKDEELINYFKNTAPLTILNNGLKRISDSDSSTVTRLREECGLSDELITLLICYSLTTNNYKMHTFNFYKTIAIDWKKKDIDNARDAYYYINELYAKNKEKSKKEEISSLDWFDEFWRKAKEEKK